MTIYNKSGFVWGIIWTILGAAGAFGDTSGRADISID